MLIETTSLADVIVLTPTRHQDARGYFCETYSRAALREAGIACDFVQDNQSMSRRAGTLRGLHAQRPPHAQSKLVRCLRGAILDVAVDFRSGSPSFGHWVGVELSAENGRQLFIPEGFLHGFVTRADDTEVFYKCSAGYAPEADMSVNWQGFGIDWGLASAPVLSDKDRAAPAASAIESPFVWAGAR